MNNNDYGQNMSGGLKIFFGNYRALFAHALLCLLAVLSACTQSTREEVIERFDSGEKKVVAVYRGRGNDESLIERRTYNLKGDVVLYEDLINGTTKTWGQLNVDSPERLKQYLQGQWYVPWLFDEIMTVTFEEERATIEIEYSEEEVETSTIFLSFNNQTSATYEAPKDEEADTDLDNGEIRAPKSEKVITFEIVGEDKFFLREIETLAGRVELEQPVQIFHRSREAATRSAGESDKFRDRFLAAANNNAREIITSTEMREEFPAWYRQWVTDYLIGKERSRLVEEAMEERRYEELIGDTLRNRAREELAADELTLEELSERALEAIDE